MLGKLSQSSLATRILGTTPSLYCNGRIVCVNLLRQYATTTTKNTKNTKKNTKNTKTTKTTKNTKTKRGSDSKSTQKKSSKITKAFFQKKCYDNKFCFIKNVIEC